MANESVDFAPFIWALKKILDEIGSGKVYFVVDSVSKDNTYELCKELSKSDTRFYTIWAPGNKNVVDAYIRGYREAFDQGHDLLIEMDAGMSHDPRALPMILRLLCEGNEAVFGSRFINGGSMADSSFKRKFISKSGTFLANFLLGTSMYDMTSGYQGFHRDVVKLFINYSLLSQAHFYQTEIRYLLRKKRFAEAPIHYRAPSKSVSSKAITNSFNVLFYYFFKRLSFSAVNL